MKELPPKLNYQDPMLGFKHLLITLNVLIDCVKELQEAQQRPCPKCGEKIQIKLTEQ